MLRLEDALGARFGRQERGVYLYVVETMHVDLVVLASRDAHIAITAQSLTGLRNLDRTMDADEADLMLDQRLHRFTEPAALEEDVIDDKAITCRRECGQGPMEPRKERLAHWPEVNLYPMVWERCHDHASHALPSVSRDHLHEHLQLHMQVQLVKSL